MSQEDLESFETRVILRPLRREDFESVVKLQEACFPGMKPWNREQFDSQLQTFPEGQMCIELDGEIVATSASLVVSQSDYADWHAWFEVSDGGFIRNHDPEGDTLYGIEIQVHPKCRGMKLARRLYEARKELCREKNLARIVVGGRIPGYAAHKEALSAQAYVDAVMKHSLYDPVLTTQLANGFVLHQLIPDYFPSDEDSAGYATHLEWPNLDYRPARGRRMRRAVDPVRVAAVQYQMREIESFEDFEKQVSLFVDVASDNKADFVCFPELFTLQLLSLVKAHRPGQAARELASFTPRYLQLFGALAVRYNVNIIGGSTFTVEGEELHNIAYLFRRDGSIERQPKVHVTPNERKWWGVQGGNSVDVFETDRGRIAILICYDVEFPELVRIVADKGARLLFVPFNTNDRYGYMRVRLCAQARCVENQLYAVTAGCVGNLPFVENADIHYAQSGVFTPSDIPFARDGVAAEAHPNLESVIIHDLDTEILRRARRAGTVQNWNDRRQDLYRVVWTEGGEKFEV